MAVHEGSALYRVSSDNRALSRQNSQLSAAAQRLPILNTPHYRFKIFRSKGAVLVLFWSFSAQFVVHFLTTNPDHKTTLTLRDKVINPVVVFTMCMLFYPILGWLADVKCGRYRVIKWGLWTMWVVSILFCLMSAILNYFFPHTSHHRSLHHIKVALKVLLYTPICLGLGGFLSNILQFGIDQLVDASSSEITSFLRWFAWLWFLSGIVTGVSQSCLCNEYESLGYLVFPALITVAIALDFMINHWLVKEPPSSNPLALIYQVLRYAVKNKYPRQRSAFTYWEEKPYSRIDLAKHKYGGPFTTDQVEDVKTFFRIISIVLAGTVFISMFLSAYPAYVKVMWHLTDKHYAPVCSKQSYGNCFQRASVEYAGYLVLLVLLPVFEFVFYPFFERFFRVSILRKVSVGMVVLVLSLVACTAIEFVANHRRQQEVNVTCPSFNSVKDEPNTLPLDYKWMAVPHTLNSVGQFLLFTSVGEFLCAQSPYSMKGFMFGVAFGSTGFFTILGYGIMQSIAVIARKWLPSSYGCMSWYLLMCLALLLVMLVIFFSVFKCYKKRMRNDSEHNEQIFAVNYYSQCHDSTE